MTRRIGRTQDLVTTGAGPVTREPGADTTPQVGQWYWVQGRCHDDPKDATRWLGCVVKVGSNYAKISSPGHSYQLVHFDKLGNTCELEPDAAAVIAARVATHRSEVDGLLGRIRSLTESLGVSPRALEADGETQAIAVRGAGTPLKDYQTSLSVAKDKTLPELFKAVGEASKAMGLWMSAELLPLQAELEKLDPIVKSIKARILNVELYAGLTEEVALVRDGAAAVYAEPVRLMQRMHYMDEECLAQYRTGGMEFKDLGAFDRWVASDDNFTRLLPFPRCVVAMRVRRDHKGRGDMSLRKYIGMLLDGTIASDKATFLYLRNGNQLHRLSTAIDFGEKLFPNLTAVEMTGQLYAKMYSSSSVERLATEGEVLALREQYRLERLEADAWKERLTKAQRKAWRWDLEFVSDRARDYVPWTRSTVHYDVIHEHVSDQTAAHNRLALVLQGLLDRSPVFHPHPPWQLWTDTGFSEALALVHDDDRALVPGPAPDFEAYRTRLNVDLHAGSVTVGQEDYWEAREAEKYNRSMRANYRVRDHSDVSRHRPRGNDGPGLVARVAHLGRTSARFTWTREKLTGRKAWVPNPAKPGWGWDRVVYDNTEDAIAVPLGALLNVSAYTPGDFRQFYADPRTRADYLKWAPLLLAAEEWHAGNKTGVGLGRGRR